MDNLETKVRWKDVSKTGADPNQAKEEKQMKSVYNCIYKITQDLQEDNSGQQIGHYIIYYVGKNYCL